MITNTISVYGHGKLGSTGYFNQCMLCPVSIITVQLPVKVGEEYSPAAFLLPERIER